MRKERYIIQTQEKRTIEQKTRRKYLFVRLKTGLCEAVCNWRKTIIATGYVAIVSILWIYKDCIFRGQVFSVIQSKVLNPMVLAYAFGGLVFLIIQFGTPLGSKQINENLWRIGLVNHAGEAPLLVRKYRVKGSKITVMEFASNGIPRSEWTDKQEKIETALGVHIIKVEEGKNKKQLCVYTVSGDCRLPQTIEWKGSYLSGKDFELVLGQSMVGKVTVDLAKIPHILLGGSTGSGKSVLLKLLLMQSLKKGAAVYIADFKGGVDFSPVWHTSCNIVMEETALLNVLTEMVDELENRKIILRQSGCANIGEYKERTGNPLNRIIFACDEVAEVLDKTGLGKEAKELVTKIEGKLSVIARQGRAFGIHLILATQRPDATILAGQIRNNIDYRVCGRADNVLSQIILDNTDAAGKIPKDAQGRFLTQEGVVFQGYWMDEKTALAEI